jgi:hypothetical protein
MAIGILAEKLGAYIGLNAESLVFLYLEDTDREIQLNPSFYLALTKKHPVLKTMPRIKCGLEAFQELFIFDLGHMSLAMEAMRKKSVRPIWMIDHELESNPFLMNRSIEQLENASRADESFPALTDLRSVFLPAERRYLFSPFQRSREQMALFKRALVVFPGAKLPLEQLNAKATSTLLIGTLDPDQEDLLVNSLSPSRHSVAFLPYQGETPIPEGFRWVDEISFCLPSDSAPPLFHRMLGIALASGATVSANTPFQIPNVTHLESLQDLV